MVNPITLNPITAHPNPYEYEHEYETNWDGTPEYRAGEEKYKDGEIERPEDEGYEPIQL
jgi:hypothetical protein